jgi:hypothetical protein
MVPKNGGNSGLKLAVSSVQPPSGARKVALTGLRFMAGRGVIDA